MKPHQKYVSLLAGLMTAGLAGCVNSPKMDEQESTADVAAVQAVVETEPIGTAGDAADDPAIWIHPSDPSLSVVIGTNKKDGGLVVYDLSGKKLQYARKGETNNVDVRYGFPFQGGTIDIVMTENRSNNTIAVYRMNPGTRQLEDIAGDSIPASMEIYGSTLYHSRKTGAFHAYVGSKTGAVEQYELKDNGQGGVSGTLVRTLKLSSTVEGMVADDVHGTYYVSEEERGIWKFSAEPDGGVEGELITEIASGNPIPESDVEGLAIYNASRTGGYLIASSQGVNEYVVFDREGSNEYIGTFRIGDGPSIGGAEETDGIEVTNVNLGGVFSSGMFVAQDGHNGMRTQNFKMVPWEAIATPLGLKTSTQWSPRK